MSISITENRDTLKAYDAIQDRAVTEAQVQDAIARQSEAFDKDDLIDVLYEHGDRIISCLAHKNQDIAGVILSKGRKETIARRASMELYGKPDVIKASEVVS